MMTRFLELSPTKTGTNSLNDKMVCHKTSATSDFGPTWNVAYDALVLQIYTRH
jgi:hypothetical protein